jgi:hypothetical protein
MGLALTKSGMTHGSDGKKRFLMFLRVFVSMAIRIEDNLYSVSAVFDPYGSPCIGTFDFGPDQYKLFSGSAVTGVPRGCQSGAGPATI